MISSDGYVLTNFHVAAPYRSRDESRPLRRPLPRCRARRTRPRRRCGALLSSSAKAEYPVAELGDSDTCRVGQWVYVVGNPFLLAEDFKPTVTYGILSGVHRYQFPSGTLLEYSDCLQTDAAINPGNSGGPMFDAAASSSASTAAALSKNAAA